VGHCYQDFDTGTYMSCIFLYVTVVPLRLHTLYPIEPFAIQDREQWFVGNIR